MANIYVRSTDGSDADNGSTWALAKATLTGAAAIDAAGDRIWVSDNHAESTAGNITIALAGTNANPVQVLCGDDAAEPPTALATTGTVTGTNSGGTIAITGACYVYGLTFQAGGAGAGNPTITHANAQLTQRYESCNFRLTGTGAAGVIRPIAAGVVGARCYWKNCSVKYGNVAQGIQLNGWFHWNGGGVESGGSSPTALIVAVNIGASGGSGCYALIENCDFSNASAGVCITLASSAASAGVLIVVRNCKMPSSWSGGPVSGTFSAGNGRVEMYNCAAGATNYMMWIEDYAGSIRDETTIVRTGGVYDGERLLSWKMVSSANVAFPVSGLYSPDMAVYNDRVGTPITVTVEFIHDSATALKDNEIGLDLSYAGSSASPIFTSITDLPATVITTAADQAASSATWATGAMSNPNKRAMSVTFTPQMIGWIIGKVWLYKASTTVYVDYVMTIT